MEDRFHRRVICFHKNIAREPIYSVPMRFRTFIHLIVKHDPRVRVIFVRLFAYSAAFARMCDFVDLFTTPWRRSSIVHAFHARRLGIRVPFIHAREAAARRRKRNRAGGKSGSFPVGRSTFSLDLNSKFFGRASVSPSRDSVSDLA